MQNPRAFRKPSFTSDASDERQDSNRLRGHRPRTHDNLVRECESVEDTEPTGAGLDQAP